MKEHTLRFIAIEGWPPSPVARVLRSAAKHSLSTASTGILRPVPALRTGVPSASAGR
jgi:hypothetical protein